MYLAERVIKFWHLEGEFAEGLRCLTHHQAIVKYDVSWEMKIFMNLQLNRRLEISTIFCFEDDDQLSPGERAQVMEERGGAGFGNESRGERVVDEHHVGVVLVAENLSTNWFSSKLIQV